MIIKDLIIKNKIYTIRGKQAMLDSELATSYEIETGALNRSVKRNKNRFPRDFMFQLTRGEFNDLILKCQNGTSNWRCKRILPYINRL